MTKPVEVGLACPVPRIVPSPMGVNSVMWCPPLTMTMSPGVHRVSEGRATFTLNTERPE